MQQTHAHDLDTRAAQLVAAADPAAVAAVLAEFPEAEDIGMRADPDAFDPHAGRKRAPKDPAQRVQYLRDLIERLRGEVEDDIASYNRYRYHGLAAVSAFDICIASSGRPLQALRTALDLTSAHISYGLTMMRNLHLELARVQAALGHGVDLTRF